MEPTLVILAAGLGRRFGGLKQLEPVGPGGATIIDYSLYDALRAGFGKVVFVVRPEMHAAFRASLGPWYQERVAVAYAIQHLESLPDGFAVPAGRTKPWGTGHAVLAARAAVTGPFAVVNADDFYGANSFATLSAFLREQLGGDVPTYAMVGYALRDTLTESGTVNRAVCHCDAEGWLREIVEVKGLERLGNDGRCADEGGTTRVISGDTRVSMNMWGFGTALFDQLAEAFRRFLQDNRSSKTAEFHLPSAIGTLIRAGRARVKMLSTDDVWCGITHAQDKSRVVGRIRHLTAAGRYPSKLWS